MKALGIRKQNKLKTILGSSHGGPSISWDEQRQLFVLYCWYDAPVGDDELVTGASLEELIDNYENKYPNE
jgi:hypothetical protein